VWSRLGGGCQPNRNTRQAIERAGFTFDEIEEFTELPRWMLTRPMLQGSATLTPSQPKAGLALRRHAARWPSPISVA